MRHLHYPHPLGFLPQPPAFLQVFGSLPFSDKHILISSSKMLCFNACGTNTTSAGNKICLAVTSKGWAQAACPCDSGCCDPEATQNKRNKAGFPAPLFPTSTVYHPSLHEFGWRQVFALQDHCLGIMFSSHASRLHPNMQCLAVTYP